MSLRRASLAMLLCLSALGGCTVGEDYKLPELSLPSSWSLFSSDNTGNLKQQSTEEQDIKEWWRAFGDANLNRLMLQAEKESQDASIALARVREARSLRVIASSAIYPQVDARGGARRGNEQNIFSDKAITLYDGVFDASWEIDLFGGTRRAEEAAEAAISAREAELDDVMISLRAEVARTYIEYRNALAQLEIAKANAADQQKSVELNESLFNAGLAPGLQVAQARALQLETASAVPEFEARAAEAKSRLAVAVGVTPDKLEMNVDEHSRVPVAQAEVVVDTPAAVIAKRPDVRVAERELASATALTGEAIAEMYPKLTLGGVFGIRNTSLAGGGSAWSMSAGMLQPIFNSGRIRANIEASDARQEVAYEAYEKRVVAAVAGVEAALVNYLKQQEKQEVLAAAAKASEQAVGFADERFEKGLNPYLDVLVARRDLYAAERALADSRASTAAAFIGLQKELGL